MSAQSSIEWTDATWNPTRGCRKISPGCKHCYAEVLAERFRGVKGHPYEQGFDPRLAPDMLDAPLHWKKPRMVFVNSMSDLFLDDFQNEYIAAVFGIMAACPQHTFQVLTKRASRLPEWFAWTKNGDRVLDARAAHYAHESDAPEWTWPLPNLWIGVSVEDQQRAGERIPELLKVPAAVRFLSVEPLLGPVDLTRLSVGHLPGHHGYVANALDKRTGPLGKPFEHVDWVIVGGESGAGARPMAVAWMRSIVAQCIDAGVPVFCKQWGARPVMEESAWRALANVGPVPLLSAKGETPELRGAGLVQLATGHPKGGDPREWWGGPEAWPRQFPEVRR